MQALFLGENALWYLLCTLWHSVAFGTQKVRTDEAVQCLVASERSTGSKEIIQCQIFFYRQVFSYFFKFLL